MTVKRWQKLYGFPLGTLIGPNTRIWTEDEITEFLASRPTESKPAPPRSRRHEVETAAAPRKRGRPRKNPLGQVEAVERRTMMGNVPQRETGEA